MSGTNAVLRVTLVATPAYADPIGQALGSLGFAVSSTHDVAAFVEQASRLRPDVAVVEATGGDAEIVRDVRTVLAAVPECCVVLIGANVPPAVVSRAVSAGARGFLLKPFQVTELAATIREAHANLVELRRLQGGARPTAAPHRGSLIAVYSPKGGVGCTTIATNLAVALAERKRSVALVDLDLQFGDVGIALDLRSANSIVDLVANPERIDKQLIDEVFVRHESGLRVLLGPDALASVDTIDPDRVNLVLAQLRQHFDFVICDLWSSLEVLTMGVLRAADRVILVTTPELPALKNLRRAVSATTPPLLDERSLLVVNRYPGKAGVELSEISRGLGRPVAATIPSEGARITRAINLGISLFDSRAAVRASRSYRQLADLVASGAAHAAPDRVVKPVPGTA